MNKTEKLICLVLGAILAWYVFTQSSARKRSSAQPAPAAVRAANGSAPVAVPAAPAASAPAAPAAAPVAVPDVPEQTVVLENDQVRLELSTWGAVVKKATLKQYARHRGKVSADNPALEFDFSSAPLGELGGVEGLAPNAAYAVTVEDGGRAAVFSCGPVRRRVALEADYRITYEESFAEAGVPNESTLSLGCMAMGSSKNDLLSVDSWLLGDREGKVIHHCEGDSPLKPYLVGGVGGCGGAKSAAGLPSVAAATYGGTQKWVALKNRFFVTAMASSSAVNSGFSAQVSRDLSAAGYRPASVSARLKFPRLGTERTSVFYVGPKKQSILWELGMRDVMEFGMWRWICYPLVWVLNLFNGIIPSFGVAIILLTLLVRLLFWPLTHKSTVGMKRMQELQPKMKEIQAKFKDNPQRLQQETWALYRDAKVNPLSSCLPMLIQIPVFIALFNVLRSAVELRYAPFLWIGDLSEPEGLFASVLPFGGLNVLPLLMAATMALQSALTPATGDRNQQKMMIVFMPVMMLVMFYNFPSALSLYWTLSQVVSILQMWLIRRQVKR